ncbi:MAG: hypothetical protein D6820_02400, partial [Lentisphaerae bacterium]
MNILPRWNRHCILIGAAVVILCRSQLSAADAIWQYHITCPRDPDKRHRPRQPADVFLWIPPHVHTLRAILIGGRIGIESELVVDPQIRNVCRKDRAGIVYFSPHPMAVFHYWQQENQDAQRLLDVLARLAEISGHEEIRRIPWITIGHSTAGIFARNVAYWNPNRTAAVIHIKSGNFHQQQHLPPHGTLAGIPLLAINGQFETFGPEGGLKPHLGRETQWVCVREDIQKFRRRDPNHLMSLLVQPGADHFHGAPSLAACIALFIRKTMRYRVPQQLPPGDQPVQCLKLQATDGWLSDPDFYHPTHPPAPYTQYSGDPVLAMWHYDKEMAETVCRFMRNLDKHQVLATPSIQWLDVADGWSFTVKSSFLDKIPVKYGGHIAGRQVAHSSAPICYFARINEPLKQITANRFQLLRPIPRFSVAAYHPGDDHFRSTIRWRTIP